MKEAGAEGIVMRLKEDFLKIINNIDRDLTHKKWVRGIFKCLLVAVVLLCMILCLLGLVVLIYQNVEYIIIVVGGVGCMIAFVRSALPERPLKQKEEVQSQPEENVTMQYDTIMLESTYKRVREGFFNIILEIADVIGVRKPTSHSQMDAPTHYDIVANVPIYHLLVTKTDGEKDAYTIMGILQNVLEQKLNNNEFYGISQTVFFYNGQAYPSIMVDNVRVFGNMLQIDVVIVNRHYCKYREQRMYNRMNSNLFDNTRDDEF